MLGWLIWQRRPELTRLAPAAWAPGLLLVAVGAVAWLLGDAGMLALARHTGLILMLQGAAIACLGKAVARGLAFPLFYMLFLVPFGEEAEPYMQTLTADMAMRLLGWAGVPAHIDGVFIATPTGNFEVAEACSGVKFLVAMLAYGALAANLCFRSWPRRILFMAACLVVPALANGVRAWGTIYIAFRSGSNAFAEGMDHIIYGWFFFGAVMILIMACAWPFFDRKPGEPWFDPEKLQRPGTPAGTSAKFDRPRRCFNGAGGSAAALVRGDRLGGNPHRAVRYRLARGPRLDAASRHGDGRGSRISTAPTCSASAVTAVRPVSRSISPSSFMRIKGRGRSSSLMARARPSGPGPGRRTRPDRLTGTASCFTPSARCVRR